MRKQYHFRPSPGGLYAWDVQRLIALTDRLPTEDIALDQITEIDENWWYAHESEPTVRSIVEHARLINDVDQTYPIIIDPGGRVMDGMHRVAKALLLLRGRAIDETDRRHGPLGRAELVHTCAA